MVGRPAHPDAPLEHDQAARLEPAQALAAELGRGQRPLAVQALEHLALAGGQPLLAGERRATGAGELRHERPPASDPARESRREHERQGARGRRAVLARHPLGQRHEIRGQRAGQHLVRLGEPARGQLGAVGERGDDPERPPAAERHREQRSDLDAGLVGPEPVVERAAHRAGAGQRLDACDHRSSFTQEYVVHAVTQGRVGSG